MSPSNEHSAGLMVNFQFGKTLRANADALVVMANMGSPSTCAGKAVVSYIVRQQDSDGT